MEAYNKHRKKLTDTAVKINKAIGAYYEDLEPVIENYTAPWLNMGFDEDALLSVANYCFLKDINKLSAMNALLLRFYKEGRVTLNGIRQYIDGLVEEEEFIKKLYTQLGLEKNVINKDRETVSIWLNSWGISQDLILYAASSAKGKAYSLSYMNQILSSYKDNSIDTVEKALQFSPATEKPATTKKTPKANSYDRDYTREQLSVLFDDLNTIDKVEF
jgi:DnaD/phage-associated family protein